MMIIHGTRTYRKFMGNAEEQVRCRKCGKQIHYMINRRSTWFTLFWLPIFPFKVVGTHNCPFCDDQIAIKDDWGF